MSNDWKKLEVLRELFLGESLADKRDYWDSPDTLELYDRYFAERIGWKWDRVLTEIRADDFPSVESVLDFGCGTGMASRKVVERLGTAVKKVKLWDRSPSAMKYAQAKLTLPTEILEAPETCDLILISHVVTELSPKDFKRLWEFISSAGGFIWVEPGTKAASQRLIEARDRLRSEFRMIAPCTHQNQCGLLRNEKDWCHHFAKTPSFVSQDSQWSEFGRRMKIDLRSLPLSYLVGTKKNIADQSNSRIIGRPRHYKGYSTALVCNSEGVKENKWLSRSDKELIQSLEEGMTLLTPPSSP